MILLHPNVQLYCFECHFVTKIKYGHPWQNKVINRSQNTVHKVTYGFNVQTVQIFGRSLAWANSCRVRGRLSPLMMAWPKSSNACSIGSISRGQRPICFKKFFHCSSHIWTNVVVLQPNVVSIFKFFLGVEGRGVPEYPATWRRWRFHPEPPMTFFLLYEYRPIPPLSRHHIEPVPEYSNVGGSHNLTVWQSVFHLYDQRCSALSSWRQHIASVRSATF